MSAILSIEQICERALRKIGAFAIRSHGARPEEIAEARYWLDMVVGHETSRQRTWWMVESTASFLLRAGVETYDLAHEIGATAAPNGIQFVVACRLYDNLTGNDVHDVPIVRREEWELRNLGPDISPIDPRNPANLPGDSGAPVPPLPAGPVRFVYIDRKQSPMLSVFPLPDATSRGLKVVFQGFSNNFTNTRSLDRGTQLRTAWNLWIVMALAAEIGSGPVRRLPADEVKDMQQQAQRLRDELEAYENSEQTTQARVHYYDGV